VKYTKEKSTEVNMADIDFTKAFVIPLCSLVYCEVAVVVYCEVAVVVYCEVAVVVYI